MSKNGSHNLHYHGRDEDVCPTTFLVVHLRDTVNLSGNIQFQYPCVGELSTLLTPRVSYRLGLQFTSTDVPGLTRDSSLALPRTPSEIMPKRSNSESLTDVLYPSPFIQKFLFSQILY